MKNKVKAIYITGIDGSGKTILSKMLKTYLKKKNKKKVIVLWMRFNHYLSKILLGIAKLNKLSHYEYPSSLKIGYWEFYKSKLFSHLFIIFQLLDNFLAFIFKLLPKLLQRDTIVILDRFKNCMQNTSN